MLLPQNILTLFQCCCYVDMTSHFRSMSNQFWSNVGYVNVEICDAEQRPIKVVYFNVDITNVRHRQNNVVIFNVEFYNVDQKAI